MIKYDKGFVDIYTKTTPLDTVKWDKFNPFELITIHTSNGKYQVYPHSIMDNFVYSCNLEEYDDVRYHDGKQFYCGGQDNLIGTVNGSYNEFCEIVDIIMEYRENQITTRMTEVLGNKGIDFDFYDYTYASITVKDLRLMEDEDTILERALSVFDEFNLKVKYEWDYDGDEYSQYCDLEFIILT